MFLFRLVKQKLEAKRIKELQKKRKKFDDFIKNKNYTELTDEEMVNIRG